MQKKFATFFKLIGITVLIAAGTIVLAALTLTSLEVNCDLQDDRSYTCQSRDTLLGVTLSEVSAEQVYTIDRDLTCKGSGPTRGCSARAEFKTATGDQIALSRKYTDPSLVQKVVSVLDPLMAGKSTPIDMVFPPSTFVSVITISIPSCVFIILILTAFLMLLGKDVNNIQSRAVDEKKQD